MTTPDGTSYRGFKVTIGGIQDPTTVKRTYDDINKIFKANPEGYKVSEERDELGHFKAFTVSSL